MAEKEERILIDVINPGINCVYRLDNDPKGQSLCKHNGNMEPVTARECRHCDEGMTRQEAIKKMAKARYTQSPCYDALGNKVSFEDFREDYEPCYEDLVKEVEPLLNALLEVE